MLFDFIPDSVLVLNLSLYLVFDSNDLFYSVSVDGNASAYVSDSTLYVTPFSGFDGLIGVTVYVSDGYLSDSTTFNLEVIPINDPPDICCNGTFNMTANETFESWINVWDIEEDTLIFEVWGDSPDSSFYSSGGQQYFEENTLHIIPGLNWSGTLYDTIRVFDGQDYSLDMIMWEINFEPIWGCTDSLACNYDLDATEGENEIYCYYEGIFDINI